LAILLDDLDDSAALLVVAERVALRMRDSRFTGVAERRMPQIVAQPNRLDQILVEPQRAPPSARSG
jgi:hypothetical protein